MTRAREDGADPQAPVQEDLPRPRREDPHADGDDQEHDQVAVVGGDAGQHADPDPPASVSPHQDAEQAERDRGPEHQVRSEREERVPGDQWEHRGRRPRGGQNLGGTAATEFTRDEGDQQEQDPGAQRRDDPQSDDRVAEQGRGDPRDHRCEGRGVEVSRHRVLAEEPEVEFVAVVAVPGADSEQDRHRRQGMPPTGTRANGGAECPRGPRRSWSRRHHGVTGPPAPPPGRPRRSGAATAPNEAISRRRAGPRRR
jgi:hypothetical protein